MLDKMTQIIREQTGDESIVITRESVLLADLGMNSFDLINMVCVVEDEFDIEIPIAKVMPENFESIESIAKFINECR